MSVEATPGEQGDLLVRKEGSAGVIVLNRPKALNALTLEMTRGIVAALDRFEADPDVAVIILEGAGERGLCAGGDIRSLYESARSGGDLGKIFWREEYVLNARIARLPKSYVAYMDGIVMGGGVGLSAHAAHRVVTERTKLAMPEVGVGFFPDVGGTWLLAKMPGETGTYFGLTGATMTGADAVYGDIADVLIETADWPTLRQLLTSAPRDIGAAGVRALLSKGGDAQPAPIAVHRALIDQAFAHDSVEAILEALAADGSDFALTTRATILEKSPTGLKLTMRLLREARASSSLEECLVREYRAALEIFVNHDFPEGVRAAVIDKDRNPRWSPATLEQVTPDVIARYFMERGDNELKIEAAEIAHHITNQIEGRT